MNRFYYLALMCVLSAFPVSAQQSDSPEDKKESYPVEMASCVAQINEASGQIDRIVADLGKIQTKLLQVQQEMERIQKASLKERRSSSAKDSEEFQKNFKRLAEVMDIALQTASELKKGVAAAENELQAGNSSKLLQVQQEIEGIQKASLEERRRAPGKDSPEFQRNLKRLAETMDRAMQMQRELEKK